MPTTSGFGLNFSAEAIRRFAIASGAHLTDSTYPCFLVTPAEAGVQGRATELWPPVHARGRHWVPAFAGMTKKWVASVKSVPLDIPSISLAERQRERSAVIDDSRGEITELPPVGLSPISDEICRESAAKSAFR
jgi:hypothetical protein